MFNFGPGEMVILFIIVLLVFGPSQLPKLARGLGDAMREFRKAQRELSDELHQEATESKPDASQALPDNKPPDNKPIQYRAKGGRRPESRVSAGQAPARSRFLRDPRQSESASQGYSMPGAPGAQSGRGGAAAILGP